MQPQDPTPYITPKELKKRWVCSRSTVDRIARREGFTRLYLGVGNNGAVRYLISEVEAFEDERLIEMAPEEDGHTAVGCRGPPCRGSREYTRPRTNHN